MKKQLFLSSIFILLTALAACNAYNPVPSNVTPPTLPIIDLPLVAQGLGSYGYVDKNGTAFIWGELANSFLTADEPPYSAERPLTLADEVQGIWLDRWAGIYLKEGGTLWGFGNNYWGALLAAESCTVEPILLMEDVVNAAISTYTVAAIKTDGTAWLWGFDSQRAHEANDKQAGFFQPVQIGQDVAGVYFVGESIYLVQQDGTLLCLGTTHEVLVDAIEPVEVAEGAQLITGQFILKTDGSLWRYEEEGTQPIKLLDGIQAANSIGATSVAVSTSGDFYAWGDFSNYQMGNTAPDPSVPTRIMGGVAQATADEVCALILTETAELIIYG